MLCTRPTCLDFNSASSLKPQSADRHVAPLGHIIRSQPEATRTNFIVFGLTRSGLKHTIYRSQDEHPNHNATDAVFTF